SFSYVVRLGETAAVHPAERVTNLKPSKANRQPHQILSASAREHCHMPARFQHAHTLFPHRRWWNKRVPVSAHEPAAFSRHRYGIAGNPCLEYIRNLLWLRIAQTIWRIADHRVYR